MYILALGYTLLSLTISWASPALIAGGDVSSIRSVNHSEVQRGDPTGINCGLLCSEAICDRACDGAGAQRGAALRLANLIQQLPDNIWYNNEFNIGASSLHRVTDVSLRPDFFFRHSLLAG
jgi:hypothetical protein